MRPFAPAKPPPVATRGAGKKVGDVLGDVLGVGAGVSGLVKGMTHSDPAHSVVTDETQTRAYRQAQSAAQAGLGHTPTRSGSLWDAIFKTGPTPHQTLQDAHQRQAVMDEAFRQPGKPSFSEARMLHDIYQAQGGQYRP